MVCILFDEMSKQMGKNKGINCRLFFFVEKIVGFHFSCDSTFYKGLYCIMTELFTKDCIVAKVLQRETI